MKRGFRFFAKCGVVLIGGLIVAEFGLRYQPWIEEFVSPKSRFDPKQCVNKLLFDLEAKWGRPYSARENIFTPPLDSFINRGFDDQERMEKVYRLTKLPPSQTWKVPNFLRRDYSAASAWFTVHSNAFGFRGPERRKEKSKNTFRVVALGSYATFGHGVNDDETFVSQLENLLNQNRSLKKRTEIWNGGRQGALAIMGLSRLERDVFPLRPDLLIWDYGWNDVYTRGDSDSTKTGMNFFGIKAARAWTERLFDFCYFGMGSRLTLCQRIQEKYLQRDQADIMAGFHEAFSRMVKIAKKNKIPVLIVRQPWTPIGFEHYEKYHDPKNRIYAVDAGAVLEREPSEDEVQEFWNTPNWLTECGIKRENLGNMDQVYKIDPIQFSKFAHRAIASFLAPKVESLIKTGH